MALIAASRRRREVLEREWARRVPQSQVAGRRPVARTQAGVRPEVAESWTRSLRWVNPQCASAPAYQDGKVATRWSGSPLRRPVTAPEAPGIMVWRDRLGAAPREAVLASPYPEHALRFGEHTPFDTAVHEHAMGLLRTGDARRALAAARLHTALRD